jgi:type I restriction enzyme M protein
LGNPESHAICEADILMRGQDISNIVLGNTLSDDGLLGKLFGYMLSSHAIRRGVEED